MKPSEDLSQAFARIYSIELLFEAPPALKLDAILKTMQEYCGDVDLSPIQENERTSLFFFKDYMVDYTDGKAPAQCFLSLPDPGKDEMEWEKLHPAIQQSWHWPDAKTVVESCRHSVLFSDLMASQLPYQRRVDLFRKALSAVLIHMPCQAIAWYPAEQIIDPQQFLQSQQQELETSPFNAFINIRMYNIKGKQEKLMDTRGLSELGLPDLQCHFKNLDPNEVAPILWNTAFYVFENGDIIADGHTLEGIDPDKPWKVQHQASLLKPSRRVLALNPGQEYAGTTE